MTELGATSGSISADDLDLKQLDFLDGATSKASDSCFELKKLCATVLAPTVTVVTILTNKKLDLSVFVVGILVIVAFWLADSVGYYYQKKTRHKMDDVWARLADRCDDKGYSSMVPAKTEEPTWSGAAFNVSMAYYALLVGFLFLGLLLFWAGAFHSSNGLSS